MPEREFKLPDLGEGLTEGEVVRWLVKEGDSVTLNQPIVEVETAKAVVEIPAPYAGTVVKLHAGEGDTVRIVTNDFMFTGGDGYTALGEGTDVAQPGATQVPAQENSDTVAYFGADEAGDELPAARHHGAALAYHRLEPVDVRRHGGAALRARLGGEHVQHREQHVRRIERSAAVDSRMEVAPPGAHRAQGWCVRRRRFRSRRHLSRRVGAPHQGASP